MSSAFQFDLAFGPGGALCCDFYDPRRHLSVKLPDDLTRILQSWQKAHSSQAETSTASGQNLVPSDFSEATPWSEESDPGRETASRGQDSQNQEHPTPDATANTRKKRTSAQQDGATPNPSPGYPKIHCLAFGSRPNESAVIFREGKEWYIGKAAFRVRNPV